MTPALPVGRTVTPPVVGGPFTLEATSGKTLLDPDGNRLTVTDLHPGALVVLAARVTNNDDEPHDARVTFQIPGDGSLTEPSPLDEGVTACGPTNTPAALVCAFPAVAPGTQVVVGLTLRVNGPAAGSVCMHADIAEGEGPLLASTSDTCITRSPWPDSPADVGFGVGDTAPNLPFLDDTGATTDLYAYRGSFVLLTISAVWCGPSQSETPQDRDEIAALGASLGAPVHQVVVLLEGPTVTRQSTVDDAATYRAAFDLPDHVYATEADTTHAAAQFLDGGTPEAQPPVAPTSFFITPEGEIFRVRLGAGEPGDTTETFQNAPAAPAPTMVSPPTITGVPSLKRPMSATTGRWGGADSYAHTWSRCAADGTGCRPIAGATSPSYQPVAADRGHRLRYDVIASRRGTPAPSAGASVGGPSIDKLKVRGSPRPGKRLRARVTTSGAEKVTYVWKRGATVVGRKAAYRLTEADLGKKLVLVVVVRNALGADRAKATSKKVRT